ncbi:MAG: GNAT family N-acetyltransferase [Duncaniella sp.]|nr:GNAT family N-acetyltransferase [Duncaniella sp.]
MGITLKQIKALPSLMRWRIEVIRNVFGEEAHPRLLVANRQYYRKHIADDSHLAFVAECDGEEYGCGGVCLTDELPSPDNPSGRCAYLMNIYVREAFRNRGVAHLIVTHLIEEAKRRGCGKIYLESTADGKPVYTSLGFKDMPDMMKYYDTDN